MAVLDRSALADSPLADLHAIASELGVDGFRRLRREDLIDAILAQQGGEEAPAPRDDDAGEDDERSERPRRRRGGRGRGARDEDEADAPPRRSRAAREEDGADTDAPRRRTRAPRGEADAEAPPRRSRAARDEEDAEAPPRRSRAAREERPAGDGPRRRERGGREERPERPERAESGPEQTIEGVVELLPNGSAFVRVAPPETSDADAYLSAAQVRRCELVAGDRVSGPVRPPRRSERHPSLVRVEAINGQSADQVSEGVRFDELPAAFPAERLTLAGDDPVVQAIDFLAPIGRGSRVTIAGPPRTGKSEALRRLTAALAGAKELECVLVLAGVRPEELAEAAQGPLAPEAALSFATSADAQTQAIERAIEHGKRVAARGGDAVVLIDTLDGIGAAAARKALAAARNLVEGGSLTVIATAAAPLGGETTVVALDAELAGVGRFPAIDLLASGTLRPELLVGEEGAAAIAEALAEALA